MKVYQKISFAAASVFLLASVPVGCGGTARENEWKVVSEDGCVAVSAELKDGGLYYSVARDGKPVVRNSATGLETDVADFTQELPVPTVTTSSADISYSVITGKKSSVKTHYEEMTLAFEKSGFQYEIIFRAYRDGYAFRYRLAPTGGGEEFVVIGDEATAFALPASSTTYLMTAPNYTDRFDYERNYSRKDSDKINGVIAAMPMLYQTEEGVWSLVTESDVVDSGYRGSFLEGNGEGAFRIQPAYTQSLSVVTTAPFLSPWRVGIVGSLADIVESTLVEDVYDEVGYYKPDNYDELSAEEKAVYDYEWVTPSKCAWTWLQLGSGTQQNWAENKKYIKMAADEGWNWFLIDAGWIPYSADQLTAFTDMMDYAKSLGVHMMCWAHSYNDLGTEAKQRENIARWKAYGFEGMKVDFFDGMYAEGGSGNAYGESQFTENLYRSLYRIAAENQMILNIHGACKPTGERRVYPNVISREGVRGNEYKKQVSAIDCVTIPFIRGAVGPSDYTPSLVPFSDNTTVGSQMAMHVMYETGVLTMGDSPEHYARYAEAFSFLSKLPVAYDDIRLLSGTPMSSCVIARRKADDWYVGGMSVSAKTMQVDLSVILDAGKTYEVTVFSDGDTYLDIRSETYTVTGGETLNIKVIRNGGFAAVIKQKG